MRSLASNTKRNEDKSTHGKCAQKMSLEEDSYALKQN